MIKIKSINLHLVKITEEDHKKYNLDSTVDEENYILDKLSFEINKKFKMGIINVIPNIKLIHTRSTSSTTYSEWSASAIVVMNND